MVRQLVDIQRIVKVVVGVGKQTNKQIKNNKHIKKQTFKFRVLRGNAAQGEAHR